MTITELVAVWTPLSAVFAIASGVLYGASIGWIATNPTYSAGIASHWRVAILVALFVASTGLVFFAFQALGSLVSGDPLWTRVMSRYGQWLLFSLAIGVTTWFLVRRDRHRRRRLAHDRALAQSGLPKR